jgi:hypothetical protein
MVRARWFALIAHAALGCGSSTPVAAPAVESADPLALPGGSPPRLYAAVDSADPEFGFAFDAATHTAYFDRASADRARMWIYQATWADGGWALPEVAPWSGRHRDVGPALSPDGKRLYFSSDRPSGGDEPRADFDLWYLERGPAGWSQPRHLAGDAHDDRSSGMRSIAADRTLYFDAAKGDGGAIVEASPTADGYGPTTPVALALPPGTTASNPLIAPDRGYLIHVIEPGPSGGADLAVSYRNPDGTWQPPQPLLEVNSAAADFAPALSPDGRYLFFTSERPGVVPAPATGRPPGDVYQVELELALPPR